MLPTSFALLVAVAGWYYMFYSRAACSLAGAENHRINRRRIVLRRVGGLAMLLLGIFFYAGFNAVDPDRPDAAFFWIWTIVMFLLLAIVALGAIDLLMTRKLRGRNRA
jgi:hypothetical protein